MHIRTRSRLLVVSAVCVLGGTSWSALADGTLFDNGVLELSFDDGSGTTQISAENDGNFIYTTSGANSSGERFARYLLDGTLDLTFASGVDFRSIFTDNQGNLFAKAFGAGNVYSLTSGGVATFLYTLNDQEFQASADFNGDDSELLTRGGATIRRYDASDGSFLGQFTLQGMQQDELDFPAFVQMETNLEGRIFTYANGVVSEWDLTGNRIGNSAVATGSPTGFLTTWSFGVGGDDRIYLFNQESNMWDVFDIGIIGDADGDGIPDGDDACPESILTETIVIDGCDTGVENLIFDDGCTMSDLIAECAEGAANHGQFVSCVAHLTNEWKHAGLITGQEKGAIQSCAAQSTIPGGLPLLSGHEAAGGGGLCPEDVHVDGTINVLDLIDLLLCFGLPATPGCESEDINGDGSVNVLDLIDLLLAFGTACP